MVQSPAKPGAAIIAKIFNKKIVRKLIRFPIEIICKPPAKPGATFQPRKVHWHVKLFIIVC